MSAVVISSFPEYSCNNGHVKLFHGTHKEALKKFVQIKLFTTQTPTGTFFTLKKEHAQPHAAKHESDEKTGIIIEVKLAIDKLRVYQIADNVIFNSASQGQTHLNFV